MAPTQQKALLLQTKQGEFAVRTIDVPKPGPGEILVKVEVAGLNPVDWVVQAYGIFVTEYPAVLGSDSAGEVVELGEGVTSFAIGDKVLHQGNFGNSTSTFQQYVLVPAEIAAKVPSNLTIDQAGSIPLTLCTAAFGLYAPKGPRGGAALFPPWEAGGRGKYTGKPILIFGGSSSVGQYAIQLAKLSGFSPIIATASLSNAAYLKSLGASEVVDRNLPLSSLPAAVKEITKEPITVVYDAVASAETQTAGYELLASGGTLIAVLDAAVEESKRSADKHIADVFANCHYPDKRATGVSLFSQLAKLFESGDLKPNNVEVLPGGLAAIPGGLKRLQNGQISAKKLVVHPQDTA